MSIRKFLDKYNMNHETRGIAVVINIREYDKPNPFGLEERVWSEKDVENLKRTLEYLEFEVMLLQNISAEEIKTNMQVFARSDVGHSEKDCFLCVVMAHGSQDKITARDNNQISFEEIIEPIKSCPTLINKPKLFFFQSCRGIKEMESSEMTSSLKSDPTPFFETSANKIETESDLLIYYSTLPNYVSWANNEGTIFIQCFCDVLSNEAYKNLPDNLSLSEMITKINGKIREHSGNQLGDPRSTLIKEIYFTPKNVRNLINIF